MASNAPSGVSLLERGERCNFLVSCECCFFLRLVRVCHVGVDGAACVDLAQILFHGVWVHSGSHVASFCCRVVWCSL